MESDGMTMLNLQTTRSWKNAEANLCIGRTREECPALIPHEAADTSGCAEAWRSILATLGAWQRDRAQREDEGVAAPSLGTVRVAIDLAERCKTQAIVPPDDVTSDADGGIILRRHQDDVSEEYHVSEDGIEYRCFVGTRLDERIRLGGC